MDLHGQIMNIAAKTPHDLDKADGLVHAYRLGHRDARHAAAELASVAGYVHDEAAAELRRLAAVEAQRDALLEALRTLLSYASTLEMRLLDADGEHRAMQKARAAIKAVEGEKT